MAEKLAELLGYESQQAWSLVTMELTEASQEPQYRAWKEGEDALLKSLKQDEGKCKLLVLDETELRAEIGRLVLELQLQMYYGTTRQKERQRSQQKTWREPQVGYCADVSSCMVHYGRSQQN